MAHPFKLEENETLKQSSKPQRIYKSGEEKKRQTEENVCSQRCTVWIPLKI